ncbi:SAM-dependent methyltransferase [Defluviimonas sp. WL0002]|uniref:SAM-dependent methyltransferase n=1 Tax=Albidovulum marisflavi TaxID=2984159 RepID=A0ABT2ZEI5_9RHOB|nr:SAM-dependent methyltransferase [Defluviimonas sp. WL0002]MCV2869548.1 SAM-dependent methyltransferase [Defluviimonas sp. WL0002]
MSPLAPILAAQIATEGPMSLADFMAACLLHPQHGYYATRDPLGRAGDFTTAPEISQMFGEMLGLCLAQAWVDQGRPSPFLLAEIGPGRGTLMSDVLRAIRAVAGMADAAQVHLVEASPVLRSRQRERLGGAAEWHATIESLPDGPLFLVANEFFDALPIRQFVRHGRGWCERQVGLSDGRLTLGLGPETRFPALAHRIADTVDGDIVELCPAAGPIAADIADRIARFGGAALVIDYGGWHSLGDTFQAVRGHRPVDPLVDPGDADLTAHVDFEALAMAMRDAGAAVTRMTPQGVFLERLGITARAQALARKLRDAALAEHVAAHRRLTHPEEMGEVFKVIACHPTGTPAPAGLDVEPCT